MLTLKKLKYLFLLCNVSFLFYAVSAQESEIAQKVTGTAVDASTHKALAGIKIQIPGYSSALTNDSGYFTLKVPDLKVTLLVSGLGYNDKEVPLKGRSNVNFNLYEDSYSSVYDNATLPNGTERLNRTINAVSSIKISDNSWKQASDEPAKNFQGKLAGLNIISRSGAPGIGSEMFLRGYSSLNANNRPLVIVDGTIYDMNDYGTSIIDNYYSDPLSNIDSRDIDNITLVKDAFSQYGSKAGNGILYITTSHATETTTKIDFNVSHAFNFTPKQYPVLQSDDYRTYLSELLGTTGLTSSQIQSLPFMIDDPSVAGYNRYHNNTNWQDQVFQNSSTQDYFLKVTGGDETALYGLSIGYMGQDGIVKKNNYSRFSVRFNGDIKVTNKFKINANLSYVQGNRTLTPQGLNQKTNPVFMSLIKAPFLHPNDMSDEGKISPNFADADFFGIGNPAAAVGKNMKATNENYRFFGNIGLSYTFSPALTLSSLFGVTTDKVWENTFKPQLGIVPDTLDNLLAIRTKQLYDQRLFSLNNDTRLSYHKSYNSIHDLSVMAGFRYNYNSAEADLDRSYNSATDELNTLGDGSSRETTGSVDKWNWLNMYGGLNYAFNSKYFLSANVGIDGSSRFGHDISGALSIGPNKFGVFPSIGAAWLVSSENFMANARFIELFKLRVSYGITGNDDIGNYNTRQLYTSKFLYNLAGLVRQNIANTSLQWETNKKFNIGADLSLFNERLNMSLDVYRNTIDHMLTYETQPSYVGVPYIITNNGAMKGKGAEYTLNGRILNGTLKWDLGFSVAYSKNKITKLPENFITGEGGASIISTVNGPVGGFYGYVTNGVYTTDEEAINSGLKLKLSNGDEVAFRGGDVRFVDRDGNGVIDENDRKIIGDASPEFYGMISTSLHLKRVALDAYFSYSYGNDIYNYTRYRLESMSGPENQTPAVLNRWMVNGQVTDMPRAEWGDPRGNSRFSDRWIEDGSYLRLKCVTLSYQIPFKNNYFKSLMIYTSAYNLLTFTKYKGFDPEFSSSSSPLLQGIDATMVPQYRTFMVGLKLGL